MPTLYVPIAKSGSPLISTPETLTFLVLYKLNYTFKKKKKYTKLIKYVICFTTKNMPVGKKIYIYIIYIYIYIYIYIKSQK
jgi:hypothetical protein